MAYLGNAPAEAYSSIDKQTLTGNGGTSYTLDHSVANENEIEVFVNNVRQEPSVAYTVAGTALTMGGNVESSDDFYIVYQGKALQTVTPPIGSITSDMFSDGLVLGGGSFLGDSGGETADIIRVHEKELNTSVTIATNTNGLCAGPLTLATGVTITVGTGATLVIA